MDKDNNDTSFEPSAGQDNNTRHKVGIDAFSLLDDDGNMPSAEEVGIGNFMYKQIIKSLDTEREKFIVMALDNGYSNFEIAFMLNIHPSRITRNIQKIRIKLAEYRKARI